MRALISVLAAGCLLSGPCFAKTGDGEEAGKTAEVRACTPCHSLRLIHSQRLSAAAWSKEVDKMIGWGAAVSDKQVLIDYLAQHYNNTQPPPAQILSR